MNVKKTCGIAMVVVLVIDLLLTTLISNQYISCNALNDVNPSIAEIVTKANLDMNKVESKDGKLYYVGGDKEEQNKGNDAIAKLSYKATSEMAIDASSSTYLILKKALAYIGGESVDVINPGCYIAYYNGDGVQLANGDGATYQFMKESNAERDENDESTQMKAFIFKPEAYEKEYSGEYDSLIAELDQMNLDQIKSGDYYTLKFKDLYVDGPYCVAKNVSIVQKMDDTEKEIKSFDFSNTDLSNYEKFVDDEKNAKIMAPFTIKCVPHNASMLAFHEYENDIQISGESYEKWTHNNPFMKKGYQVTQLSDTGSLYRVVAVDLNFFKEFAAVIFAFYAVTLLLAFVISFVIAKVFGGKK